MDPDVIEIFEPRCRRCWFGWDRPNEDNNWCERCDQVQLHKRLALVVTGFLGCLCVGIGETQGPLAQYVRDVWVGNAADDWTPQTYIPDTPTHRKKFSDFLARDLDKNPRGEPPPGGGP